MNADDYRKRLAHPITSDDYTTVHELIDELQRMEVNYDRLTANFNQMVNGKFPMDAQAITDFTYLVASLCQGGHLGRIEDREPGQHTERHTAELVRTAKLIHKHVRAQ